VKRSSRAHAARVAAIATLVVAVCFVMGALVVNVVVSHQMSAAVDTRLADRLADVKSATANGAPPSTAPADRADGGVDEAPAYVWSVDAHGAVTPLSPGAPSLPHETWTTAPTTLDFGGSTFRVLAAPVGSGWVVAASSAHDLDHVQDVLLAAELILGAILVVATFAGAFAIGLRAMAPVEGARRRQAEFAADASHELRTPLSVIKAEVDLASEPRVDAASQREALIRVGRETARLEHIVNDLLWLARSDADALVPDAEQRADLGALAADCVERFGNVATAAHVALACDRDRAEAVVIRAPSEWIDRLLSVLVDNACRYGSPGRVDVSVSVVRARAVLRVDDAGPGIPESLRADVFDRFRRLSDEPGGTGLGLAIADSIVRATHGSWVVGTSPLGGARFEVSWRRLNAAPTPSPVAEAPLSVS
jgi:signal transduction histidine kinase